MRFLRSLWRDCCVHGVPYRWPEWCVECESAEVDEPEMVRSVANGKQGD